MANNYGALTLTGSELGTVADNDDIDFGKTDFTIDVSFTVSGGSGTRVLLNKWASDVGWKVQVDSSGALQFLFNNLTYTATAAIDDGGSHTVEICVDRVNTYAYIFIDGTLDGILSLTSQGTVSNSEDFTIGYNWVGNIAEIRLSNRVRSTAAYTVDVRQFVDDPWTKALYHFNEAIAAASTCYDMSTSRHNITFTGSPVYAAGPFEACPVTICREQVWHAIDTYTNLTNFLLTRKASGAENCKYRYRPGDVIPGQWTAEHTPALSITPLTLPDIVPETSAYHRVMVPIEIQGRLHHKSVDEIEFFWWLVMKAIWSKYQSTTTAGRFNYARIQHMTDRGPSFEVQEQQDSSLFSRFSNTLLFEVRHAFLS